MQLEHLSSIRNAWRIQLPEQLLESHCKNRRSLTVVDSNIRSRRYRNRLGRLGIKLLLEGKFLPKSVIAVDVDPVLEPGVFRFSATQKS